MKSGKRQEAHEHDQGAKNACDHEDRTQSRRGNVLLNRSNFLANRVYPAVQAIFGRCNVFLQRGNITPQTPDGNAQPVTHNLSRDHPLCGTA